ncbi:phage replication initiation protein, NGO0469 family [Larkinella soli]|uniref:phage replication initiation protein, NGO0469 family n=1 Tax=Larkinella soli TaxID=1770527 RepID=UPI000FFC5F34|nr:hypothetical protein [Larkinella soli]
MAIYAESSETQRELVPEGNHIARCYMMVEVGKVMETFEGSDPRLTPKAILGWELPMKKKVFSAEKGEEPFTITKEYSLFMSEKANLRKDLESWRGKVYTEEQARKVDITAILGHPCMLNIVHKASKTGKIYAKIASITPMPEGFTCPAQITPTLLFSWDSFTPAKLAALPEWIQNKLKESEQYRKLMGEENPQPQAAQVGSQEPVGVEEETGDLPF